MGQISTKTHGAMDYATIIIFLLAPRILHFQTQLTTLLTLLATVTLIYGILTCFEWGVLPIIPTRIHLITDCVTGMILCILALSLKLTSLEYNILLYLGLWIIVIALMTPSRSLFERQRMQLIRSANRQHAVRIR